MAQLRETAARRKRNIAATNLNGCLGIACFNRTWRHIVSALSSNILLFISSLHISQTTTLATLDGIIHQPNTEATLNLFILLDIWVTISKSAYELLGYGQKWILWI